MTTPAEPDTGAGAAPDTGSAPEDTTSEVEQPATGDWTELIQQFEADGLVPNQVTERLRASRKHEQRAKANKQQLDDLLTKQQGEPTIEDLQQQLASEREAREAVETKAAEWAYRDAVNSVAAKTGLDADALRDSGSFQDEVTEELGGDFDDDDLRAAIEKVAKSKKFAGNPRFAGSKAPARSGADFTGAPSAPPNIDQAIADAQSKGDFRTAIALKRRRPAG